MEDKRDEKDAAAVAAQVMARMNAEDRFCQLCGIQLTTVEPGRAEGRMTLTELLWNGLRAAQGGAIFTLADFTFAGAANSYGRHCVVQCASINFLRPGLGKELRASAEIRFVGRRTCFGDVSIVSDEGKLVAQGQYTGCFVGE